MRKLIAYILFTVFFGFLLSISTNFTLYVKVLNGGSLVEDVNSIPEEHNESGELHSKLNASFTAQRQFHLIAVHREAEYFLHQAELLWSFYPEVPTLPPEQA